MTEEQFRAEKLYQATMNMARRMLSQGLISEEEYCQIDTIFLEKYCPVFGTLFSATPLTSRAQRVIGHEKGIFTVRDETRAMA